MTDDININRCYKYLFACRHFIGPLVGHVLSPLSWSNPEEYINMKFLLPQTKTLVFVVMRKISKSRYALWLRKSRYDQFVFPLRKSRFANVSTHSHRESSYKRRKRKDFINQLPDDLLHQILLKLRTKDSVTTSVLSRRWRYVWKHVPGLDLNYTDFRDNFLKGFVNKFLDRDKESRIYNLKLKFDSNKYDIERCYVKNWINSVVTRGVQHLVIGASSVDTFEMDYCWPIEIPVSICMCETLVHLKLASVSFVEFEYVYLPRLETMHLSRVWFPSDAALEKLISSSQVLRDLKIKVIINVKVLRVRSQTLRSLNISAWETYSSGNNHTNGVVIDAPLLSYLSLETNQFINLTLNNLCSSTIIDIRFFDFYLTDSSSTETFRNLLDGISKATNLTLSRKTLQVIYDYWRHVPLPNFSNVTNLQVTICPLDMFFSLLACCLNLKSLVFHIPYWIDGLEIPTLNVPSCLLTSLEVVRIVWLIKEYPVETKVVEYFLRNAAVLKKLNICLLSGTTKEKYRFVNQILSFPRRSSACQVFVDPY